MWGGLKAEFDVLADYSSEHLHQIVDGLIEVDVAWDKRLAPAERKELTCQPRGAVPGVQYFLDLRA